MSDDIGKKIISVSRGEVSAYYKRKTIGIIRKYGPGPRVHYHTGLYTKVVDSTWGMEVLNQEMRSAQERLLKETIGTSEWAERDRVVDAGCGLGGTALFLASQFGCVVHAITNVPEHIPYIKKFAEEESIEGRVIPMLCNAEDMKTNHRVKGVISIEASCYFERERWFRVLNTVVETGGLVHVVDCFASNGEVKKEFDSYWRTNIGSLDEYVRVASRSGFYLISNTVLNDKAKGFWPLSIAWSKAALMSTTDDDHSIEGLHRSIAVLEDLSSKFGNHEILYCHLVFARCNDG